MARAQDAPDAQDSLPESAVKASYLIKFAPFVTWPHAAAPVAGTPFVICVIGTDPFGDVLDSAVNDQSLDGRPIQVRRLPLAAHDMDCQIAFIGGSPGQPVADAIGLLGGAPILTVTDGGQPAGIIDFATVQGRVRFRIDDAAAAQDGLSISSKLLSLALSVNPRAASGPNP
jgi:hypothetical protein